MKYQTLHPVMWQQDLNFNRGSPDERNQLHIKYNMYHNVTSRELTVILEFTLVHN